MQTRGKCQLQQPTNNSKNYLQEDNSIYDLPTKEEYIKWIHTVCGYPVKSTWIKAIKAGNFTGWTMINQRNIAKYYPETTETPKGHMNQTMENFRSTNQKATPLEEADTATLKVKKMRDIYTKVYEVRNTVFSDQT